MFILKDHYVDALSLQTEGSPYLARLISDYHVNEEDHDGDEEYEAHTRSAADLMKNKLVNIMYVQLFTKNKLCIFNGYLPIEFPELLFNS